MTYEQEKESLARVLRDKIFSYKAARPNLSSSQIASKFGMSNSTFSRLENLDIKNPTFDQIIKIFNGTGAQAEMMDYLKRYYPQITRAYMEAFPQIADGSAVSAEVKSYVTNPETCKIMLLAFSECGVSKDQIKEEYGNNGVRTLEYLVDKTILIEKDERFFPKDKGVFLTQEDTKFLAQYALENFYDVRGFEEETASNYLTFQSEGIDLDRVYPQIISLLRELTGRVRTIFNNPENHGEDTVFVSLISDSIMKNDLRKRTIKGKIQ